MAEPCPIELVRAGVYRIPDTEDLTTTGSCFFLIATGWDGPKGGDRVIWELAEEQDAPPAAPFDREFVIDRYAPADTLADARVLAADVIEGMRAG